MLKRVAFINSIDMAKMSLLCEFVLWSKTNFRFVSRPSNIRCSGRVTRYSRLTSSFKHHYNFCWSVQTRCYCCARAFRSGDFITRIISLSIARYTYIYTAEWTAKSEVDEIAWISKRQQDDANAGPLAVRCSIRRVPPGPLAARCSIRRVPPGPLAVRCSIRRVPPRV